MVGYVFTKLRLQSAFTLADRVDFRKAVVDATISAVEEQGKTNADALTLVARQLDPEEEDPSQEELNKAIAGASPGTKKQAFDLARRQRKKHWLRNKALMELTIPVFRALIAADSDERYHRHFAELGYALKDSRTPNYRDAEAALTKAIEIRDREGVPGFPLYELNRALCRIGDPGVAHAQQARQPRHPGGVS